MTFRPSFILLPLLAALNFGCASSGALRQAPDYSFYEPSAPLALRQQDYGRQSISQIDGTDGQIDGIWYSRAALVDYAGLLGAQRAQESFRTAGAGGIALECAPAAPLVGGVVGAVVVLAVSVIIPYAASPDYGSMAGHGALVGLAAGAVLGAIVAGWGCFERWYGMGQGANLLNRRLRDDMQLKSQADASVELREARREARLEEKREFKAELRQERRGLPAP